MLNNWLLAMAQNAEAVRKAQEELDYVVGSDRLPTWEDENNLLRLGGYFRWNLGILATNDTNIIHPVQSESCSHHGIRPFVPMSIPFVLIVGAGPSGLLLALLLGKRGIPVRLLEAADSLDDRPRAAHYSPPAVYELRRAGIIEDMEAEGSFLPNGACWRKLNGEFLAAVSSPGAKDANQTPLTCLPLNKLNVVLQRQIDQLPHVEILHSHKVTALSQDDTKAWVTVETPNGLQTLEAQYIVGCDGANSKIRRSLFGAREFPGFTWDKQIVATNVYILSFEKYGFDWDSNFIIHPEHWYMAARISNDGLWRVSYGEVAGLSFDELKARQPAKFKAFLPGSPDPGDYRVANFSPYKVHQRLAKKMRVGRFLLAADAAHLCNPFGGLGLSGGIVDVGGLYDCLAGIYTGQADDSILDIYCKDPETALEESEFLKTCKKAETDDAVAASQRKGLEALQYDFTRHYRK
ncbi:hypothetical protein ABOM_006229 [Aspergillus bombycis]|uniref:FAD-binding domain-containing protein n=1 Tax=Aspergillus bombycis TaxID=109264 RepID=A0A1F8A1N1_9EURO|nr:hypothetical protein ABOM_006229 [Aspergillus bombycis]OGM45636.1 hypothetical protein ABOM_006229 [Aspergillus bombycis]